MTRGFMHLENEKMENVGKVEHYYCEKCQNVTEDFLRHGRAFGAFCPICQRYTRHKKVLKEVVVNDDNADGKVLLCEKEDV